jgi:hypothetical protein
VLQPASYSQQALSHTNAHTHTYSERIKGGALGGPGAVVEHFNEAVHINQSLTPLGRVISTLVEALKQRSQVGAWGPLLYLGVRTPPED